MEEAAQAMLAALDDAEQKEFAVQLTLAPVGSGEDARYELAMGRGRNDRLGQCANRRFI